MDRSNWKDRIFYLTGGCMVVWPLIAAFILAFSRWRHMPLCAAALVLAGCALEFASRRRTSAAAGSQQMLRAVSSLYDRYYEFDITNDRIIEGASHFQKYYCNEKSLLKTVTDFCENHVHPDDREIYKRYVYPEAVRRHFNSGICDGHLEYRTTRFDGPGYRWKSAKMHIFMEPKDMSLHIMFFISDITQEREAAAHLSMLVEHDPLTGLFNKTSTEKYISEWLGASENAGKRAALFMVDIDNFKKVNDVMGHLFGDAILSSTAQVLRGIFGSAVIGRIGGDEFMIFAELCAEGEEEAAGERICTELSSMRRQYFNMLELSASVGAALYPKDGGSFHELYNHADMALYHAKDDGKACWRLYDAQSSERFEKRRTKPTANDEFEGPSEIFSATSADNIFSILYGAREPELAIHAVIELMVRQFRMARGYIFENSADGSRFSEIYEYCGTGVAAEFDKFQNCRYEDERPNYLSNFDESGVFWMEIGTVCDELRPVFARQEISTLVQFALISRGKFVGFLGFDICDANRIIGRREKADIVIVGKILATFLLKEYAERCCGERTDEGQKRTSAPHRPKDCGMQRPVL